MNEAYIQLTTVVQSWTCAHISGLQPGDSWWLAWHWDGLVIGNLLVLVGVYALGIQRIWQRAGTGSVVAKWRVVFFFLGIFTLAMALLSPLDTLSNDLSWVHMCQHMLFIVVAAPLIVAGVPGLVFTWAIPLRWRSRLIRKLAGEKSSVWAGICGFSWNPVSIWLLNLLVLWIWHIPSLYQWALSSQLIHDIEHVTFLVASCLFWRLVLDLRTKRALHPVMAVVFLFTTSLHTMFLGLFMALSPQVWYPVYEGRTGVWGLSAIEDQQLAGLIMWMPGCMVYAVVAVGVFAAWMDSDLMHSARRLTR